MALDRSPIFSLSLLYLGIYWKMAMSLMTTEVVPLRPQSHNFIIKK